MNDMTFTICPLCKGDFFKFEGDKMCPCIQGKNPGYAPTGVTLGRLDRMVRTERALAGDPGLPLGERLSVVSSVYAKSFGALNRDMQQAPEAGPLFFPGEPTPDILAVLGTPCFHCARMAKRLRQLGQKIKTRAEDEQAAVLFFLLGHVLRDPANWRENVGKAFKNGGET